MTRKSKRQQAGSAPRTCAIGRHKFRFVENSSIYRNTCPQCARKRYPLAFRVRKKVAEFANIDAAREMFRKEHTGCVPPSMEDEDLLKAVMTMYEAIGQALAQDAEAENMWGSGHKWSVVVEPSIEDCTWLLILRTSAEVALPEPGTSQVVFFSFTKGHHLGGHETERDVEALLQGWKTRLKNGINKAKRAEVLYECLNAAKVKTMKR